MTVELDRHFASKSLQFLPQTPPLLTKTPNGSIPQKKKENRTRFILPDPFDSLPYQLRQVTLYSTQALPYSMYRVALAAPDAPLPSCHGEVKNLRQNITRL